MSKKKAIKFSNEYEAGFDFVAFSIVQLPEDQSSNLSCQRVLQRVTRNGETKTYVTESSYIKGEMYQNLSRAIEASFDRNIERGLRPTKVLGPTNAGRYWLSFDENTFEIKASKRVSPEKFE